MNDVVRIPLLPDAGRGLRRDAALVASICEDAGYKPEVMTVTRWPKAVRSVLNRLDRLKGRLLPQWLCAPLNRLLLFAVARSRRSDPLITIHFEDVFFRYLADNGKQWLIPNQEVFRLSKQQYLVFYDCVLCKTWEAFRAFSAVASHASYLGFAGHLPQCDAMIHDWGRWLHVAGTSPNKGSAAVVHVWARHPEWPVLDLVIDDSNRLPVVPHNVRIHERINDVDLEALRSSCGIALAPSEAEGFGHALFDAMARGQVVVTVDAPPMNELVGNDRGFLVGWSDYSPCRMGTKYFVDEVALEESIDVIVNMSAGSLEARSQAARTWVETRHDSFRERMHSLLEELNQER